MHLKKILHAFTIILAILGGCLLLISFFGESLGVADTAGFGVVQITLLLVGSTMLMLSGTLWSYSKRPKDAPRSLQADIGLRIIATGIVASYVAGFSDLLSIGTHTKGLFERPLVGPLQFAGIGLGLLFAITGLWMYHTSRGHRPQSSINLLPTNKHSTE